MWTQWAQLLVLYLAKRRISLLFGNLIEVAGVLFGISLIALAPTVPSMPLAFLLYLMAWSCLLFFPHGLVHFIVGVLVGVRFRGYSFGRSSISKLRMGFLSVFASKLVVLTLRVDQASLRSVSPLRRSMMFSSGAVASMILPFLAAAASIGHLPLALSTLLLLISVANLAFDLYYSPKAGDISRAKSVSRT